MRENEELASGRGADDAGSISGEHGSREGISRRSFLTLGAVATVAAAGAGLTGCGKSSSDTEAEGTETPAGRTWETAPAPITAIAKTEEYDVVVVGGGMAGCSAMCSAAEAGAKVLLLEKTEKLNFRGIDYAALASEIQKSVGIDLSARKNEMVEELQRWGAHRGNERVIRVWANNCDEAINWAAGVHTAHGGTIAPMPREMQEIPDALYYHYPCDAFQIVPTPDTLGRGAELNYEPPFAIQWADVFSAYAAEMGATILFSMKAEQLVTDASGAVAGVIAMNAADETYTQYNAKSVIMCTGGYGNDQEMMDAFIPTHVTEMKGKITPAHNTGDGIRMGAWAGGAIDPSPHCPMYFDESLEGKENYRSVALTRQPWLYLNDFGQRFENEDLPFGYVCRGMFGQPRQMHWAVWDSKWEVDGPKMGMIVCKDFRGALHNPEEVQQFIDEGIILSGATLDELLGKMEGIDAETAKESIARYNEICATGVDTDFGKRSQCLSSITEPPYYAVHMGAQLLVTLGGLQINEDLNVVNADGIAVPGLWAAGNCSGSFFFNDYPIPLAGVSHSRALTFGRVAGKAAAGAALA